MKFISGTVNLVKVHSWGVRGLSRKAAAVVLLNGHWVPVKLPFEGLCQQKNVAVSSGERNLLCFFTLSGQW